MAREDDMSDPYDYSNTIGKAASRVRGDRLHRLYAICETQKTVSTKRLRNLIDQLAASDRLDGIHFRALADKIAP